MLARKDILLVKDDYLVHRPTGEVVEGSLIFISKKRRQNWGDTSWMVTFLKPLVKLAPNINGQSARLLLYLMGTLGMNNRWTLLHQGQIAKAMGMQPSQISESLKTLTEIGVLIKGSREHGERAYLLNPDYGWRGPFKNFDKAKELLAKTQDDASSQNDEAPYMVTVQTMSFAGNGGPPTVVKGQGVTVSVSERERVPA